jgi:methylamine---glutamate N-methyltransferase subunit C
MTLYRCDVCNVFEYESELGEPLSHILPGTQPENFPADWACPICNSDFIHLKPVPSAAILWADTCPSCGGPLPARVLSPADNKVLQDYLSSWERHADSFEEYMTDIHTMAVTGKSIIEPMRTKKPVISWDDILSRAHSLQRCP